MKSKKSSINFSENNHILWLPLVGDIMLQGTTTYIKDEVRKFKIEKYLETIENVKDLKLALETANIASNRISNRHKRLLLKCLLKNYNYEDLKSHKLFEDYTINQDKTAIIHKSYESEIEFKFEPISFQNPLDRITYKYNAQKNIFFIAVVEKNIQIMEKIAKDLLNTAPVVSKLLKTTIDYPQYLQFLEHIVVFIKPEKQLEVIKNLINTITINLMNLAHFSGILSNAKEYEAVIIILESTLLNPQLPTLVSDGEEKEALYRCRTNLWSAYVNTKNLSSAEEQLLLMLKDKPNNSNFYNLFTIYRLNGKFTEAENLIQNASNDIKTLAKMIVNFNEISQSNLNSINQNNLPDNCKGMLRIFQYMAKYNKYSTAEKICFALPREVSEEENIKLVEEYVKKNLVARGIVCDVNIHYDNPDNPHMHLQHLTRRLERLENGKVIFSKVKARDLFTIKACMILEINARSKSTKYMRKRVCLLG
ncbi:MAG: MobA/MobL family protein [Rickettsia endosymbiont of Eriopis connexa]|nr:MobA/MobL family protein [Rickettsia endosymbiont of Eriopis connexa]